MPSWPPCLTEFPCEIVWVTFEGVFFAVTGLGRLVLVGFLVAGAFCVFVVSEAGFVP